MSAELDERCTRVLNVIVGLGGAATMEQIRRAGVVAPLHVASAVRTLLAGKHVVEDENSRYVVNRPTVAESRKLAGTPAADTDSQQHRPLTAVKSEGGPAEPAPREKGRPTREGTQAPSKPIACLRCQMQFPPEEFAAGPGRRRFRLCCTCGDRTPQSAKTANCSNQQVPATGGVVTPPAGTRPIDAPTPEVRVPIKTFQQLVERRAPEPHAHDTSADLFLDLRHLPKLRRYLEQLVATGLYGWTVEQCAQRLISDGVLRAIESGLINRQEIDR